MRDSNRLTAKEVKAIDMKRRREVTNFSKRLTAHQKRQVKGLKGKARFERLEDLMMKQRNLRRPGSVAYV